MEAAACLCKRKAPDPEDDLITYKSTRSPAVGGLLIPLPNYSPELNAQEHLWDERRKRPSAIWFWIK